jgi:hypothetical protein
MILPHKTLHTPVQSHLLFPKNAKKLILNLYSLDFNEMFKGMTVSFYSYILISSLRKKKTKERIYSAHLFLGDTGV